MAEVNPMRGRRRHHTGYCSCCNGWDPKTRNDERHEIEEEVKDALPQTDQQEDN